MKRLIQTLGLLLVQFIFYIIGRAISEYIKHGATGFKSIKSFMALFDFGDVFSLLGCFFASILVLSLVKYGQGKRK